MVDETVQTLFVERGGQVFDGFPAIHAQVRHTVTGTAYLQKPGVVMIARPATHLAGLQPFLAGFRDDLLFEDFLDDPVTIESGASLSKMAGQTCYLSFGPRRSRNEDASRYFSNIKSSGHGSVLEHPSFSFLFYGVSRSFTHELVRHRAGTAFSQTSQRYVDGKVLRFVERPEYQAHQFLHSRFEETIDRSAAEYAERSSILMQDQVAGNKLLSAEAKTDLRKKVQQSARSCLPNETEAPIVFSANARAMRHVIEMRANRHAELEIREVFVRVFLCMAMAEPLLFDDYAIDQLEDGTVGVQTPHRKV